ncbi:MAG TPA: Gfo/Idh/MocA family oxidoreductase [Candidatus Dormibacteraeota bacterium]|nr:Gfo/Idh/MocA family oxidoreductase [Candidatus Dormibacteraeota bacterium]
MNRRDFTQLSALTFGWTLLPSYARTAGASQKPVGYAAIGLGTVSDIFMRACANSRNAKVTALVTGHPDTKGAKYAAMYGIPKTSIYTYETFDRIVENKDVEAVYVGLPNSMHCEYTLRAARAGKHVFCEKPMAVSSAECRRMIEACRQAKVKLMIGYRVQYDPTWMQAIEIVKSGKIGKLQSFQGGFVSWQRTTSWRLSRKLCGGGSLMDLGIYPLNAIRHITGEEPVDFTAVVATRDTRGLYAEVEQSLEWTMKLPSGIIASCGCSYGQVGPSFLNINGDEGYLQVEPAFFYDGVRLRGQAGDQAIDALSPGKAPYQFTLEAEHFSGCIRNDAEPESPGEEGLKDMLAIEAIYNAAGAPIA